MTERQLTQRFLKQLLVEYPQHFWYKIGDTFGGHKKPADMLCCIHGNFVALEFKKRSGKLTDYQIFSINDIINAGGQYHVGYFSDDGKELHFENMVLTYKKGRYENIENWIKLFK